MKNSLICKKILLFILIIAILVSNISMFSLSSNAANNTINVSSAVTEVDSNNRFKVVVSFSNNSGLMGYKMLFSYDSTAVTPISVAQGKDFTAGQLTDNIGVKTGQFNVLWNSLSDFTGNGVAFEITFEKLADKNSEIVVGYSQEDTFNEDWDDVNLNCHNIQLNLGSVEAAAVKLVSSVGEVGSDNCFDVAFSLNDNTGLMGFKLIFKYNDSIIRPVSVTRGSALTVGQLTDNIGVKNGEFNVLWNNLTNFTGNGQAFIIRFEKLVNATTELMLSYSQEDTFDENWDDVLMDVSNISLDLNSQETPTTPTMSFQVAEVNQNNQFEVAANLSGNTGIMGYKIIFSYDSSVLQPIEVIPGTAINVGQITDTVGVRAGQFNVLWNNLTEVSTNGNAFTMRFELLKNVATQISVSYSQEDTFDGDWNDYQLSLNNIAINMQMQKCKFIGDFSKYPFLHFNNGSFKVLSSHNHTLLENDMASPQLNELFEKQNNVDVYIKPHNCVSFRVRGINAVGTVDINDYIDKANAKGLFSVVGWAVGDVDGDDVVDIADISSLLKVDTYGLRNAQKDLNGDEIIDIADISVILSAMNYGRSGVTIDSSALA